jgi:hypothetical protein
MAISESPAAASGLNPSPIMIAAVTATGVPKPAAPSKNAPKAKGHQQELQAAVGRDAGDALLQHIEQPDLAGQLIHKNDVRTIQPIGSNPNSAPYSADFPAISTGIP